MIERERQKVYRSALSMLSTHGVLPNDIQSQLFYDVDPNDPVAVKHAIRKYIVPRIMGRERQRPGFGKELRSSLWYFLHKQPWDPAKIYSVGEPAIDEPDNLMDFYKWAWEELFGGEEQIMPAINESNYEVIDE
jgi:hypothetical protein